MSVLLGKTDKQAAVCARRWPVTSPCSWVGGLSPAFSFLLYSHMLWSRLSKPDPCQFSFPWGSDFAKKPYSPLPYPESAWSLACWAAAGPVSHLVNEADGVAQTLHWCYLSGSSFQERGSTLLCFQEDLCLCECLLLTTSQKLPL